MVRPLELVAGQWPSHPSVALVPAARVTGAAWTPLVFVDWVPEACLSLGSVLISLVHAAAQGPSLNSG
jgi:hypothetical protein